MAGTNDFLPFAGGGGANVLPQPDYAALPAIDDGYASGIAESDQLNKTWRQACAIAYVIAQFIIEMDPTQDVLDNGNPDAIVAQFIIAVQRAAPKGSIVSEVTDGGAFVATSAVATYWFNRSTGLVANQAVTLANDMGVGQAQVYQDTAGNIFANQVTITPPAGTINGAANYVWKEDKGSVEIKKLANNVYGARAT